MDTIDAANRRAAPLPSIRYLDIDKGRRDEAEYQSRNSGAPNGLSTTVTASPTYLYPLGPPPPYSHPASAPLANISHPVVAAIYTPPESRRASGDEKEHVKQATRQSLPSIHEALGVEQPTSYPPQTSAPPPAPQSIPAPPPAPSSPLPTAMRSYGMEQLSGSSNPYPYSDFNGYQYSLERSEAPPPPPQLSYAPAEPVRPSYITPQQARPHVPYPLQASSRSPRPPTPRQAPHSHPSATTLPSYEQPPLQSAGPMGPPGSFPYGYTPYPPRYAQPTPPSSVAAGSVYQPSAYSAPSATPSWKSESSSSSRYRDSFCLHPSSVSSSYGESVKRHLYLFDLEASLNEIAASSGLMLDFTRSYGARLHQTARSGPTVGTLPTVAEVDELMAKSRKQIDCFVKMREVIITHQAAYDQQAQESRYKIEAESRVDEHHPRQIDDNAGGFAGGESKKRRGRAAPPGRCHSCNRAETPEWRRGPDGARTLCNACGLHYAKLTRKAGGHKAAAGSSNLRPKSMDPDSASCSA